MEREVGLTRYFGIRTYLMCLMDWETGRKEMEESRTALTLMTLRSLMVSTMLMQVGESSRAFFSRPSLDYWTRE